MEEPWEVSSLELGQFFSQGPHELCEKGRPPLEGTLTQGNVNDVTDKSESPEGSKYEPIHHTPRYNVCLHIPTILV